MKIFRFPSRVLFLFLAICLVAVGCFADEVVPAGFDYLVTSPGTTINVPTIGSVSLVGRPVGPGGSDTIVQRLDPLDILDRPGQTGSSPIVMTQLALESSAPVNIAGSFFDIFVDLDPGKPQNNSFVVTQTAVGEGIEGTFDLSFDVFFDIRLVPVGSSVPFMTITQEMNLTGGGQWTDDNRGNPFSVGPVVGRDPQGDTFIGTEVAVPEPSSVVLLASALLGLGARGLRAKRGNSAAPPRKN